MTSTISSSCDSVVIHSLLESCGSNWLSLKCTMDLTFLSMYKNTIVPCLKQQSDSDSESHALFNSIYIQKNAITNKMLLQITTIWKHRNLTISGV